MLGEREIEEKMSEFASKLQYDYCDLSWLKKAIYAKKLAIKAMGKIEGTMPMTRLQR